VNLEVVGWRLVEDSTLSQDSAMASTVGLGRDMRSSSQSTKVSSVYVHLLVGGVSLFKLLIIIDEPPNILVILLIIHPSILIIINKLRP